MDELVRSAALALCKGACCHVHTRAPCLGLATPPLTGAAQLRLLSACRMGISRCAGVRLRARAQAYSLGGENMHYGTPVNPACPDRVPGGSSSGSAVRGRPRTD